MSDPENILTEEKKRTNTGNTETKWYALYTRPRAEKLVYQRLIEEHIETFLPLQKTYRMWSDRKKLIEKPLLSSYIFVKTNKKTFPKVYKVIGVVKFVSFEGSSSAPSRATAPGEKTGTPSDSPCLSPGSGRASSSCPATACWGRRSVAPPNSGCGDWIGRSGPARRLRQRR